MGRIVAIDYGRKRVGIAVTDPGKIIANSLTTVHSKDIFTFLKDYVNKEEVEGFVVGEAKQMDNSASESSEFIEPFVKKLKKTFPEMPVERVDERFTSKMALDAMIQGGTKKKDRQDKGRIDAVSATIILQSYMEKPDRKF
ncbi:MAG: Holliday junction resolvase RuvX [Bacteroidales bacterium]|nr:Holliday junction resolvase RuvX [Bacteroidales bacterium]MCF8327269.1 Holliday junction resolvase RuvX [Bacteroidales bacterium]